MTETREWRHVAITGLGVVSPIGVGVPAFLDSLLSARSGTGIITQFDPTPFPCRVAAEVKVPEESLRYPIGGKELKIVKRASRLALAAGMEAFQDAGVDWSALEPHEQQRLGVWVGTGGGSVAWGEEQYGVYFR